jgi:hypothetical protein
MNDDQFENLLRGVRPAGPPPDLRARILAAQPARRAWPWAAAAAALLLMIAGLQWSAGQLRDDIRPVAVTSGTEESEIAVLRETFGLNDDEIRAMALKRDFDRIMAADAPQAQVPQ